MKKLFFVFAATVAICSSIFVFNVKTAKADEGISTSSKAAYLVDCDSGTVIYAKNEKSKLPIASMTKLMLLNLCFEGLDNGDFMLSDEVTVSKTASGMGGSQVFLEDGKNYKISELIKGIVVASANDASVAMAEKMYGSESECVSVMNDKCREWGLNDTLFSNCTGLTRPTQYSCAADVAVMLKKLVTHDEYFEFSKIWTDEIDHGDSKTEIANTNKLIRFYAGCDGGKTGYTAESGFCLAATAIRGGMRLISVVINAENSKARFADVSGMFDYGFANYMSKAVLDEGKCLDVTVEVKGGERATVKIRPKNTVRLFSKINKKEDITMDFSPFSEIKAPLKKGDEVGELIVYRDNVETARVKVVSDEDVNRKTYFGYVKDVARGWSF